jgi:hypothetical protein
VGGDAGIVLRGPPLWLISLILIAAIVIASVLLTSS